MIRERQAISNYCGATYSRSWENTTKVLLRELAARLLPQEIVARPKHGFVLPMAQWVHDWLQPRGGLSGYARARLDTLLDVEYLARMLPDRDVASRDRLVFALIMLGEWHADFEQRRSRIDRQALAATA